MLVVHLCVALMNQLGVNTSLGRQNGDITTLGSNAYVNLKYDFISRELATSINLSRWNKPQSVVRVTSNTSASSPNWSIRTYQT